MISLHVLKIRVTWLRVSHSAGSVTGGVPSLLSFMKTEWHCNSMLQFTMFVIFVP